MNSFLILVVTCVFLVEGQFERQKAASTGKPDPGLVYSTSKRYNTEGFLGLVQNPVSHFHAYFGALPNGSCGVREKTTDQAKKHNCVFATNGGPFGVNANQPLCLGSIVSDGKIIQTTETTNGYFGLTQDGDFIIGHLTLAQITSLKFEQLIMGFDWLVHNGTIIPAQGGEIAPRTMIGTNEKGELLIFEVDGIESTKQGLTLYQAAVWSKDIGGYNVMNLDGGGSSIAIYNGTIVDKPTCQDTPTPICERAVSTITCIT
jgi:exopolysaccharide biosynthesis protein